MSTSEPTSSYERVHAVLFFGEEQCSWVEGAPIPRKGETVYFQTGDHGRAIELVVTQVDWSLTRSAPGAAVHMLVVQIDIHAKKKRKKP